VTFGVWIAGRIDAARAGMYVVAQLVGGLLAGFALRLVFPESSWEPVALGTPAVDPGITVGAAIAIEAILTMVLLVAVFGTAIDPRAPKIGNVFAYQPVDKLGPQMVLPPPDAPAGSGPIQGSLLLFKLTTTSLANRPLEFRITSPTDPSNVGTVDLDV